MNEKIKLNDRVLVCFDEKSNDPASKYNGQVMTVNEKRTIDNRAGDRTLYKLEGAVSDMGVPYSFIANNLVKL